MKAIKIIWIIVLLFLTGVSFYISDPFIIQAEAQIGALLAISVAGFMIGHQINNRALKRRLDVSIKMNDDKSAVIGVLSKLIDTIRNNNDIEIKELNDRLRNLESMSGITSLKKDLTVSNLNYKRLSKKYENMKAINAYLMSNIRNNLTYSTQLPTVLNYEPK